MLLSRRSQSSASKCTILLCESLGLVAECHDDSPLTTHQRTLIRFQRDNIVLTLEASEVLCLQYPSTLLTIGRCVVLNFHQSKDKAPVMLQDDFVPTPLRPKAVRSLALLDMAGDSSYADTNDIVLSDSDASSQEWFDTDHLRCDSPSK